MTARGNRLVGLCGIAAGASLIGAWIARNSAVFQVAADPTIPDNSNFYNYTFVRFEPFALYALVAFFGFLAVLLYRQNVPSEKAAPILSWERLPLIIAMTVLIATCAGRFAVHQNFDLCIDEYLNEFEGKILAQGHLVADVPPEWRDEANAMKVPYQTYNAEKGYWASGFLPGFAALDFVFGKAGIDWALSPLLAAGSLLLLAALARRAFPDRPTLAANIAILLLASSPQFLAMALTKFAWTAHLAGALLWVWLFTHPRRALFLLTPILGALLIGLHQPHVQALIAAPFVFRLMRERRWKDFGWFSVCYVIGAVAWYQIYALLRQTGFASGSDLHNLLPAQASWFVTASLSLIFATFHAITLLAWSCPALVLFLGMFMLTWKQQPVFVRDGICAAALTFCFYFSFPHPQGNGWGFRYLHSAYGLLALAAAGGALALCREGWSTQMSRALVASLAFTVLVQIPYRAYEIRALVRPLALTWNYISTRPTDFVVIKTSEFWYSWDLIRNDPWLKQKPLIFNDSRLTPEQREALARKGTVTVIGAEDVKSFGVIVSDPTKKPAQ
jgi:hypothetical protein